MSKKVFNNKPAVAVHYRKVKLPRIFENKSDFINKLKADITFQAQGSPVELDEKFDLPVLMVALDVLRKISPEVVISIDSGDKILLFDHQIGPILRPRGILISYVGESLRKGKKKYADNQVINVETIWEKNKVKGIQKRLFSSLEHIRKLVKHSKKTTLLGEGPKTLFLLAQYFLYGFSKEIWYGRNPDSQKNLIAQSL